MTDKKQPEALRLANALEYCDASVARQAINELLRQHAELENLRTGYEAARLEVESLKAQLEAQQPGAAYAVLPEPIAYQIAVLKACEHGDALVGWRVEPSRQSFDASMRPKRKLYTEGDMHDFADRTHALRVAPHGQASAQAAPAAQGDALDAARYRFLRDGEWRDTDLEPFIRLQLNTLWDAKIDAARAAQEGKKP